MILQRIVDLVTRRPQHLVEVESSRMQLDETTVPVYERVLAELALLESELKHYGSHAPH